MHFLTKTRCFYNFFHVKLGYNLKNIYFCKRIKLKNKLNFEALNIHPRLSSTCKKRLGNQCQKKKIG